MRRKDREVKNSEDIISILDLCKTCHVAMMEGTIPYLVPLSYGYEIAEDGVLTMYFHSAKEGKKIDILKKNNQVCFELCNEGEAVHAETPCNSGYYFSSIIGYGEVIFIEEPQEKRKALSKMFAHQTGREVTFNDEQAQTVCVFKIVSKEYSGKKKKKPNV